VRFLKAAESTVKYSIANEQCVHLQQFEVALHTENEEEKLLFLFLSSRPVTSDCIGPIFADLQDRYRRLLTTGQPHRSHASPQPPGVRLAADIRRTQVPPATDARRQSTYFLTGSDAASLRRPPLPRPRRQLLPVSGVQRRAGCLPFPVGLTEMGRRLQSCCNHDFKTGSTLTFRSRLKPK